MVSALSHYASVLPHMRFSRRRSVLRLLSCQRISLADGGRADAIPNAAGGEGGHGAAKPDGVIHRCPCLTS